MNDLRSWSGNPRGCHRLPEQATEATRPSLGRRSDLPLAPSVRSDTHGQDRLSLLNGAEVRILGSALASWADEPRGEVGRPGGAHPRDVRGRGNTSNR